MEEDRFDVCVQFVLARETEYTKDGRVKIERDPSDPGGTTKYGIDQRSHPGVDIAGLSRYEAEEIYRAGEWKACRCADLKAPWDLVIFDSAVNLGKAWPIKAAQSIAGVKVDGVIGPVTVAAINKLPRAAVRTFLTAREDYYRALPAKKKGLPFRDRFLAGWLDRVRLLRAAVAS